MTLRLPIGHFFDQTAYRSAPERPDLGCDADVHQTKSAGAPPWRCDRPVSRNYSRQRSTSSRLEKSSVRGVRGVGGDGDSAAGPGAVGVAAAEVQPVGGAAAGG